MPSPLVWFKRDLRVHDHAALHAASMRAPGQPLRGIYILEPSVWQQPDASPRQLGFILESLADLGSALLARGGTLQIFMGEACEVLDRLHAHQPFDALLAHEETGNGVTYARDVAVARWCRQHSVAFEEWPQNGVVRRLRNRDDWLAAWEGFMGQARWPSPRVGAHPPTDQQEAMPSTGDAAAIWRSLHPDSAFEDAPGRQRGGRRQAMAVLQDFLATRCRRYRGGISSPLTAETACSRLSPYLAQGCLSVREVVQATHRRLTELEFGPASDESRWQQAGLRAFLSRLHWHCHFIQKLESEPEIERRNVHRGYDALREGEFDATRFEALRTGRTGWPLVDACVAMLRETGWVNFRMRAMLVSVAAYPLWLHWRAVGEWLAQQFVDYEPGIHWSQMQMQSGTTGINTTRVYNPIKQARDQDPNGVFVRRWLPAMRHVPDAWLFEPWRMPADIQARAGVRVGADPQADIPLPCVDLDEALRTAKARLHARRAEPEVRAAKHAIVERHGSRAHRPNRGRPRPAGRLTTRRAEATASPDEQLTLGF